MGTLSCTISGNAVSVLDGSFRISDPIDARSILTLTVVDSPGTASYVRGQPIILSDSVNGTLYSGYVSHDAPTKQSPDPTVTTILHMLTCMDKQYLVDKRGNTTNYTNMLAGNIVADFIDTTLSKEGITAPYTQRHDTTASDFNTGFLSGTIGTSNTSDGDLELVTAGSAVTITENTTALFGVGTLTNVQAVNNTLTPTTVSAIHLQSNLPVGVGTNFVYVQIWSGSVTLSTPDTLLCTAWCASTSPQRSVGIDFTFSDGTRATGTAAGFNDQNTIGADNRDISEFATDQWYARVITIPSAFNGKTITAVTLSFTGSTAGTYDAYIKDIRLGSGTVFFATNAIATQLNPALVLYCSGYSSVRTSAKVVQTFDPANNSRVSSAYSIDAVKLVRSSVITWAALTPSSSLDTSASPSTVTVNASYDGSTFLPCTNNGPLPVLPAGSNVAGISITLKESFASGGPDPTVIPALEFVTITLQSAANATKSDITANYGTQTAWNTGTYNGTQALTNGDLASGAITRNWNDNLITNQTLFAAGGVTESASSGAYVMTLPAGSDTFGVSRLDFAGTPVDFTLDVDVQVSAASVSQASITYRQVAWFATDVTFGYAFTIDSTRIQLGYGSNSNTGSYTLLQSVTQSFPVNTTIHLKIVVEGTIHQVYVQGATTPIISWFDSTYANPGNIGLRGQNADTGSSHTTTFDNLVITPNPAGTWTSATTSITSLGTCGPSAIAWNEVNTSDQNIASVQVQTSVDGGSTFQTCTNGGSIPNIPAGTNVSGKSVIVKAILNAVSQPHSPTIRGLAWRVLGSYSGASGTRTTLPMSYDTMTRANQSGLGIATDGQTWTKTGTGTDAISSNEATITNTTGDVYEILGSRIAENMDVTVRFSLSASTISAGLALRYIDANNFYRCSVSTTTLTLTRKIGGTAVTLATATVSLSTGTFYDLRFRVTGTPASVFGKVWPADGSSEPAAWTATATNA